MKDLTGLSGKQLVAIAAIAWLVVWGTDQMAAKKTNGNGGA